jgi:hypothetical protein
MLKVVLASLLITESAVTSGPNQRTGYYSVSIVRSPIDFVRTSKR